MVTLNFRNLTLALCLSIGFFMPTISLKACGSEIGGGIDSLGNSIVVWQGEDSLGNVTVQASTLKIGGTWSSPVIISIEGQIIGDPVIAVDSNNNVVMIWRSLDSSSGLYFLFASTLIAGKSSAWSTPVQLSNSTNSVSGDYSVKINNNKNILVYWGAWDTSLVDLGIYAVTGKFGGTWSNPTHLSSEK